MVDPAAKVTTLDPNDPQLGGPPCFAEGGERCPEEEKERGSGDQTGDPAAGPKQNGTPGTETPVMIESKEDDEEDGQQEDPTGTEEPKIQEEVKEPGDPQEPSVDQESERSSENIDKAKEEEEKEAKPGNEKEEGPEEEAPPGPDDVVCDSCIDAPRRAVKSCLTCLVSYCEAHLRPHLENHKFHNHRLVEPLRDIERRTCESHKWPLDLFCVADGRCVCADCAAEAHRGHNTVPVAEARRRIEASPHP